MADQTDAQPWTILRLLEWTREFFVARGIDDSRLEAELLLAHALGLERIQLYVQHGRIVAEPELSHFRDLVKGRAAHVPTQYLLGRAWFRNLTLKVTPAVLIPRPETEILVDEALAILVPAKKPAWEFDRGNFRDRRTEECATAGLAPPCETPTDIRTVGPADRGTTTSASRVLDLCTGSGCIALALATECPVARVVATDLSAEALAVARENAAAAGVGERVAFLQGDLFSALATLPEDERRFDLITANPPYIGEPELSGLMPEVRDHEPRQALIAGPTGLEIIDRILADAPRHLAPAGHLLMEIGFEQADAVRVRVATLPDWEWLASRKDLGGHQRVVHLRRR